MAENKRLAIQANHLFDQYFPAVSQNGHPLSFYLWLPIQPVANGRELEASLQESGVRVYHSDRFLSAGIAGQKYLRIALSSAKSLEELEQGLNILKSKVSL